MLEISKTQTFTHGKNVPMLLRNFYEPEDGYVWSRSKWCELIFSFSFGNYPKPLLTDFVIDLDVFKSPPNLMSQAVKIYFNGKRVAQYDIDCRREIIISVHSSEILTSENSLIFDTPESASPSAWGMGDERILGVQIFSLHIQPA